MILSTARIWERDTWLIDQDVVLQRMRNDIADSKPQFVFDGTEVVEVIYMAKDERGIWRSADAPNATHVKITMERGAHS